MQVQGQGIYPKFSVLMSVYKNEKIEYFKLAMDSVLSQTISPNQIVLVRDGEVPEEMQKCIDEFVEKQKCITYVPLEKNVGLGNALAYGMEFVEHEIVARMDTDDICVNNRFQVQLDYLMLHPEVDVVGGQITEFIDSTDDVRGIRIVPEQHKEIVEFMKKRNPFNHMTVMYKKSKVQLSGNYVELHYLEDYFLWCRMALKGCIFGNLPQVLVYARTGVDMFKRRGGYTYFQNWRKLEKFKLENGITNNWHYISTLAMRFFVQVVLPTSIRGVVMERFSRKRCS